MFNANVIATMIVIIPFYQSKTGIILLIPTILLFFHDLVDLDYSDYLTKKSY